MAQQIIFLGTNANDGTGESLRGGGGMINNNFTELYALQSQTINAGALDYNFTGATTEQRIQLAITAAVAAGFDRVYVPAFMLPYDPTLLTFNSSVQMIREGGTGAGYDAVAYGGRQTNGDVTEAIQAALAQLTLAGGGLLDCRGFSGSFIVLSADICADVSLYSVVPITFQWGAHEVRVKATNTLRSNHQHILNGTVFIPKDENGVRLTGITMFQFDDTTLAIGGAGNGVATTDGSAVVTKASPGAAAWAAVQVDSPLQIFGFVPPVGHDNTTVAGAGIDNLVTTIPVASTTGQLAVNGYVRIEDEIIFYTSLDATNLFGCTRGFMGTTAAAHANGIAVDRVVYQPFYVKTISGNTLTLDSTIDFTSTNCQVRVGITGVAFTGIGTIDGNRLLGTDDTTNPYGVQILGGRFCTIGPGIVFKNHDHGGFDVEQCQDSTIDARLVNCGQPASLVGAGGWAFSWNKRLNIYADVVDCYLGLVIDDRSTTPTLRDGPSDDCTFIVRTSIGTITPLEMSGCRRSHGQVLTARDVGATNAAIEAKATQWVTNGPPSGNVLRAGAISGISGFQGVQMNSGWANGNNTVVVETPNIPNSFTDGNSVVTQPNSLFLTYSTSITPLTDRCEDFRIIVTNGTAFTIANPATTARTRARRLGLTITNSSGGAMGLITWANTFVLAGAFTNPANGLSRKITFRWNEGALRWQEESRTAADM